MSATAPHGPVSTWLRLGLAFALFAVAATVLLVALLLLLPSRAARLEAGGIFARGVARPLLRVLGLRLDIVGKDRIAASPPALFLINHSSTIDTLASMAVWPRRGCGIGKKEVLWIPFFGLAYALTGNLLIDRSDRASAIAAINRLVGTIHRLKLSPLMAPEGTRSHDGRVARFKKGFVHIAVASGLPCVPIVLHNAHELWPNPGFRITPGTIRLEVLPPIDTTGWSIETIDDHVQELRQVFVEALGPGRDGLAMEETP